MFQSLTILDRIALGIMLVVVWFVLLAAGANAAPRRLYVPYGGPFGGIIVIEQPRPYRPVIVQPPPRQLTPIERERLQGVYRGTGNAEAPYGGGPVMIYNPWVQHKPQQ